MRTITLKVPRLHWDGWTEAIRRGLATPAVQAVEGDLERRTITVEFDEQGITEREIIVRIRQTGFDVED